MRIPAVIGFLGIFLLGAGGALSAQKPFFRAHSFPEEYRHVRVNKMLQASSNYIWLGTSDGLFRFDGQAAIPVAIPQRESPAVVTALFEDQRKQLWVGLESGEIFILDRSGILRPWDPEEGHPAAAITAFGEDLEGQLWIATYGEGLYCWKKNRLYNFSVEDGMGGNEIYDMGVDASGQVWCGTDRGLSRVRWDGDKKSIQPFGLLDGLPDEIVRVILADRQCGIWVGMHDGGLCRINPVTNQVDFSIPDWDQGVVSALACFHQREIWIGTESNGLFRFDIQAKVLEPLALNTSGRSANKIYALQRDSEGGIWVAGNTLGFFSANRQFEFVLNSPGDIQAVMAGPDDEVWVGAQNGLYLIPPFQDTFLAVFPNRTLNVISLFQDPFHNLWIGTFGEGVYIYRHLDGKLRHIAEGGQLQNGSILSMDGAGQKIWLATLGGVMEFTLHGDPLEGGTISSRSYDQESGLGTNYIYRVMVDSKGRTWFCTDGKGLSVLDGETITTYSQADTIPLKAVYSIAEDKMGQIWFSTPDQGLFKFDGKTFSTVSLKQGIRNLSIGGIATTADGQLLMVHSSGIDLLNPQTGHLIYFDQEVGIPDAEPNLNTLAADAKGNIWIGLPNRLVRYTALGRHLRIHPETRLEQVSVLLKPVDWWARNVFKYNENFLVFDYVGIWLTDPETVTYRYRLEGLDHDWIYVNDRRATYSAVPPGRYTFRVSSTENNAYLDEPVISYSFRILPPLWMRPWFLLLAGGVFTALFVGLMKNRDNRIKRIEKLKQETIQSQYEALKSQINPHFLFNSFNTLVAFIEENPKLAVKYVEKLSDFYRVILAYREKERISLEEELQLVADFAYLLKQRFGENFSLTINVETNSVYVVPLALQMLVENAVKHNVVSRTKPLHVRIERVENDYLLIANNLQPKLTAEPSTGFGLSGIVNRYALLTDRPVVVGQNDGEFQVRLPLLK
ncbi:MAG: histidine kinase [Lewinellaceae bacterium]|nr:histidine kinase [Lewinellaceae bacterium]